MALIVFSEKACSYYVGRVLLLQTLNGNTVADGCSHDSARISQIASPVTFGVFKLLVNLGVDSIKSLLIATAEKSRHFMEVKTTDLWSYCHKGIDPRLVEQGS